MFCHKCGNKPMEGAGFCNNCGAKLIVEDTGAQIVTESAQHKPPVAKSVKHAAPPAQKAQELQGVGKAVFGLGIAVCVLRFLDAIFWGRVTIFQILYGEGFWLIAWNIVATIIGFALAVGLLMSCISKILDRINKSLDGNLGFAIVSILWFGYQIFFEGIWGLLDSFILNIVILILAVVGTQLNKPAAKKPAKK